MNKNLGSVDIQLTNEELQNINDILEKIEIVGKRYPEVLEKRTGL